MSEEVINNSGEWLIFGVIVETWREIDQEKVKGLLNSQLRNQICVNNIVH